MKRIFSILLIGLLLLNLTGCETLRKKFTRKKKETVKMPRIYQVKKYVKKPSPELYKKHYAYWISWQSELEQSIGQNHKKDKRCMEEIVGNLRDMQNILVKEKADQFAPHIDNIEKAKDIIYKEDLTTANTDMVRRTIEKEGRYIRRDFCFTKVKDYLKKSFDDES